MADDPKPVRRRAPRGKAHNTVPPEVREERLRQWYDEFVAARQRRGIPEDGLPMNGRARGNR